MMQTFTPRRCIRDISGIKVSGYQVSGDRQRFEDLPHFNLIEEKGLIGDC
jgi:hypothetical protein